MTNNYTEQNESDSTFGVRGQRVSSKMLELRLKTGGAFAIGYPLVAIHSIYARIKHCGHFYHP